MDVLGKLRSPDERSAGAAQATRAAAQPAVRHSNGLKDFLWLMPNEPPGRLLDLGPVSQATVSFFTERGFRVSTEDLIRCWDEFEAERKSRTEESGDAEPPDPAALAAEYLQANLLFEPESFQGILAWDVFDFLETELLEPLVARLHEMLVPGGVLLAAFHDATAADVFHYRVRDGETLELVPARRPQMVRRVFQNREILALFSGFRSSRTFVGRDHLREALFLK
jgi:hypothetical protein